jgi:dihydropteroate synthase
VGARIGGGAAGFDAVELWLREDARISPVILGLDDLDSWARKGGAERRARVEQLMMRLTTPRAPFAGLDGDAPHVMGILNVTPDSFSDGGAYAKVEAALAQGEAMAGAGAAIVDVGGESTRPGSDSVAEADELARVVPVIEALATAGIGARLSIDSRKSGVMAAALEAGATIINDISALSHDPDALALAAKSGAPVILMHCRGEPKTMQEAPEYDHAPADIFDYLEARIAACVAAGIAPGRICVDPGIGFGKGLSHNLDVLNTVSVYHGLGCPVLLGVSRKSFVGTITQVEEPRARLAGSLAAALWGVSQGVQFIRAHDVAETVQALRMWQAGAGLAP